MYEWVKKSCKVVKERVQLSDYTTWKIGGICDIMAYPQNKNELISLLIDSKNKSTPYFVLGKGSNLLVSDKGFRGLVINTRGLREVKIKGCEVSAECGVTLPQLSKICEQHSLSGLEFGVGIPASVGGAVRMNAGAYGSDISGILTSATLFLEEEKRYRREELGLGYRESKIPELGIVLEATFVFHRADSKDIIKTQAEYRQKRGLSQPQGSSAGSVFKRVGDKSAGYYIDAVGLKGLRIGGAKVSEKHANFILNLGSARAEEVKTLIEIIEKRVYESLGIKLKREVLFLGER